MPQLDGLRGFLADLLFEAGAIRFGEFRLKMHEKYPNAPLSPIYLNLRTPENKNGTLTPEILQLIALTMWKKAKDSRLDIFAISPIPEAGNPIAETMKDLASYFDRRIAIVSLKKEQTESERRIVGLMHDSKFYGSHIVVVDDMITLADSKIESIIVLRAATALVTTVLVLIDREQSGAEQLRLKANCRLLSVYKISELLNHYVDKGKISSRQYTDVMNYYKSCEEYLAAIRTR